MIAVQKYVPGTIVVMHTLPIYTHDGACVNISRIFPHILWAFQLCIKCFAFSKHVTKIDLIWLYGKYKGTLLMAVTQDENNNIFPITFYLVECEIGGGCSFF